MARPSWPLEPGHGDRYRVLDWNSSKTQCMSLCPRNNMEIHNENRNG